MTTREETLVSTDELARRLGEPDLAIVDASWYLPDMKRNGREEYLDRHVPGAVFVDIDEVSDRSDPLPHMLPTAEAFAARMGALGISDRNRIVVYDGAGLFSAARVWWMLRVMGARQVAILDGGLPKWLAEGRPTESGETRRKPAIFSASLDAAAVRDLQAMKEIAANGGAQIIDARSAGRFAGEEPEPRPGLRAGHIPGSLNLPYRQILAADGTVKPDAELQAALRGAGVDPARPVVTTCGSGVTAAVLSLALTLTGHRDVGLYDGSWSEWGGADTPVETGRR
ncbi:3-mercaptopyruvate sulfurtransferase [Lutibaculum baratangense]|uniref:Sulfurtransferase n=1 Tax=Lutibaculum baratangense AMV1 TaxID=631454 RepID=V4RAZ2_9HYPH|nr:3-mercaptopyruvate sulfurtransferase [Lutibaculum baratangense]ESR23346.1 Thiosulfate sulfurtransferase, rhodanese [Lutibaculum baratangense AMV1]